MNREARRAQLREFYANNDSQKSLKDLIQQASAIDSRKSDRLDELTLDVGNLNSARHALVYNHHHQVRFVDNLDSSPTAVCCRRCYTKAQRTHATACGYRDIATRQLFQHFATRRAGCIIIYILSPIYISESFHGNLAVTLCYQIILTS